MEEPKQAAIIVTGTRKAVDDDWYWIVESRMREIGVPDRVKVLIHGDQGGYRVRSKQLYGIDSIAEHVAESLFIERVEPFPYLGQHGKAGGPIRNRQMNARLIELAMAGYDVWVEAFHDNLPLSRGTRDMCEVALRSGLFVFHTDQKGKTVEVTPEDLGVSVNPVMERLF